MSETETNKIRGLLSKLQDYDIQVECIYMMIVFRSRRLDMRVRIKISLP